MKETFKRLVKGTFRKFGVEITRYTPNSLEGFVSLKPPGVCQGNALLSLWIKPFLLRDGEPIANTHTHNWESLQIAKTFLDLGYSVDVVDYRNEIFVPRKDYAFFVAFRTNFERIARRLNSDCIKVAHLDTAHWLFNNNASFRRGLELQRRRGVTLTGRRIVETNLAIEYADYATVLGNQFTMDTYRYAGKPLFRIPISTCAIYPWPGDKDFDTCRKHFLWFSSNGLVHKGLDLVLEAFAEMPEFRLTVCGSIHDDGDFLTAYHKELYQTQNIQTIGWVDLEKGDFSQISEKCIGFIYPSCSEGQAGAVIQCLHSGLIPIVSYESGVDVDDSYGIILSDCSIGTIKGAVQMISNLSTEKLRGMSRKAWEFARTNHTRERFAGEYKKVIAQIIEDHQNKTSNTRTEHSRL